MKTVLFLLALLIIGAAAFMARSDWWIVPDINRWQANILGENRYFPMLTVFILAIPPLLVLALLKIALTKKKRNY